MVYMNNSELWAQGSRCYEELRVVDDMNDSGYHELKALDALNSVRLWLTWTTPGCKPRALKAINNSGLWMAWTTLGCGLNALDTTNNSRLWLTWTTLGCELRALDAMNNLGLWLTWMTLGRELRALDAINSSSCGWNELLLLVSLRLKMLWTT